MISAYYLIEVWNKTTNAFVGPIPIFQMDRHYVPQTSIPDMEESTNIYDNYKLKKKTENT